MQIMNTPASPIDTIELATWNIKAGGFEDYDPTLEVPNRSLEISTVIADMQADGVDTLLLTDTYRWDTTYRTNHGIARHLGFNEACFVGLNDARLTNPDYPDAQIGITFATDHKIAQSDVLDLGTRNGLRTILDVGHYGLQIAGVYLDDMDEDVRSKQVTAMLYQLDPNLPTILAGDFNALRDDFTGSSLRTKAGNLAVRMAAALLPASSKLGQSIRGMNERMVVPTILFADFVDGDPQKRPTAPAAMPAFGIDYIFGDGDLTAIENFEVLPAYGASDHRPIRATIKF